MQHCKERCKDYLLITLGAVLVGIGVYFFKFPNHFSTGGISGISIILSYFFPNLSAGAFVFIMNQLLLIIGFISIGKSFGFRTVYASIVFSCVTWGLEYLCPMEKPFTTQPMLELLFAVGLPAIGSAILFNEQASTGGTDIVAMILKKHCSFNIGNCLLIVDFLIAASACLTYGMEAGLYSILGLVIKAVLIDMVLESFKIQKCFQIITSNPKPIENYIINTLHRGATALHGEGVYTQDEKTVIITVVHRNEAVKLRNFIHQTDAQSFMMIINSSEIIGKGFRGLN